MTSQTTPDPNSWGQWTSLSRRAVDPGAAAVTAGGFLGTLGIDIDDESKVETPQRMARAYAEMLTLPGDRILGLSKLARLVDFHSRRAQTQEPLTKQIADHLQQSLLPRGAGAVIEAEDTCMSLRGARVAGARRVTSTLFGRLRDDAANRAEFLARARPARGSR